MSKLPPPPPRRRARESGPSMLDKNREVEQQQEQEEAVNLKNEAADTTGRFAVSPISVAALAQFDDLYNRLKRQQRPLKRYQLAEAIFLVLKDPEVQAKVVYKLKNSSRT